SRVPRAKSGGLFPKIRPLPGSQHAELKRCGKTACRCARGGDELHGPYFYRRWRQRGRLKRQYVRPADLERMRTALALWREQHPRAWEVRRALAWIDRVWRDRGDWG